MALAMKPACERCGNGLAMDGEGSVCSFECTFCRGCAGDLMQCCPNCGGELATRPRRATGPKRA
ncbi:DUF1272 domain-containing protein [Pelagibius sp.]|uniref:DUF1272 domain-containing protein n=1 Tax=Pelagibius sp. TaxID=1931238 RepID=UPI002AC34E7A|nr:DUF1272 domain-containing protein [Pelagibius sp.]